MTTDNFCFYLPNRLIQTSQTGGQWYSDTSPFSIPWTNVPAYTSLLLKHGDKKRFYVADCRSMSLPFKTFHQIHKNFYLFQQLISVVVISYLFLFSSSKFLNNNNNNKEQQLYNNLLSQSSSPLHTVDSCLDFLLLLVALHYKTVHSGKRHRGRYKLERLSKTFL